MANIEKSIFNIFNEELKILKRDYVKEKTIIATKSIKTCEKGIFKKESEIKREYVKGKGDYISLMEVCNLIGMYTKYIYDARNRFKSDLKKSYCQKGKKLSKFVISYRDYDKKLELIIQKLNLITPSFCGDDYYDDRFEIICDDIPHSRGSEEVYRKIKDDVYKFLAYVYSYKNYKNAIFKNIVIGEITSLKIEDFDALNNKGTIVTVKFGDLAVFEIELSNDNYKISSFSRDANINLFLKEHGKELLEQIFINKKDIKNILDIFDDCSFS